MKSAGASTSVALAAIKVILRTLSVGASMSVSRVLQTRAAKAAGATAQISIRRSTAVARSSAAAMATSLQRAIATTKAASASMAPAVSMGRAFLRTLSSSATTTADLIVGLGAPATKVYVYLSARWDRTVSLVARVSAAWRGNARATDRRIEKNARVGGKDDVL